MYKLSKIKFSCSEGLRGDKHQIFCTLAYKIYETMGMLGNHGITSKRGNRGNKDKSCPCNGHDKTGGASFTFGCSIGYYNCCKFGPGNPDRDIELNSKFKLEKNSPNQQIELAETVHNLADDISPIFKAYAPDSFQNMTGMCMKPRENICKNIIF